MNTLPMHARGTAVQPRNQTKKSNLFSTASLITAISIAERGLGFLYRIVLSRCIGGEGVGLYQISLSLFAIFLTLGTSGIPVSVSRFISKANAKNSASEKRSAVGAGVVLCLLFTLPFTLILLPFAQNFTFLFSDSRAVSVFKILLLGLCFSAVYAVIRGAFWGDKDFLTPSLVEIAEETVMVIVGVILLKNVESSLHGAQSAAWAAVISYLFSFTLSLILFFLSGKRISTPKKQLKPLFNATLPITSVRLSATLVNAATSILFPVMLIRSGVNESEALRVFGIITGMSMPLLFIPSTIIGSISLVLLPELAEDFFKKNFTRLYQNITRGLYAAVCIALFMLPFFLILGKDLGAIAFHEPLAGVYVQKGCFILLPMSLTMLSTSTLNALGYEKQTFIFYFVGAFASLLCNLILPAKLGEFAYLFSLFISFLLTGFCNLFFLHKTCPKLFSTFFKTAGKKLGCAFLLLFPITLFGMVCLWIFRQFFGAIPVLFFTGFATLLFSVFLHAAFSLLPKIPIKNKKK